MYDEGIASGPDTTTSDQDVVAAISQTICGRQHEGSGREPSAALGSASGEDGTPRPGTHAQPEAVRLGPTTVVRLESALAHRTTPQKVVAQKWRRKVVEGRSRYGPLTLRSRHPRVKPEAHSGFGVARP